MIDRPRLPSIDVVRGFVMVVMALDHVRPAWTIADYDPTDLARTNPAMFATRWITHVCAPTFVFLAGTGAALSLGRGKTPASLSRYLLTRGLWLVALELTIVEFGMSGPSFWTPDLFARLQVIWALGVAMIVMAALVRLPLRVVVAIGLVIVVGHNLLDPLSPEHFGAADWLWRVVHESGGIGVVESEGGPGAWVAYPVLPWFGVMALGYAAGRYLASDAMHDPAARARIAARLALALLATFFVLRTTNVYGDLYPWSEQPTTAGTVMSFFNVHKYPPSLAFLCVTLGLAALGFAAVERWRVPLAGALEVFGRVPLFFYVIHLIAITTLGQLGFRIITGAWPSYDNPEALRAFGYGLPVVYAIWLAYVLALYWPCRWFASVKKRRRDWWLGYL